nr:maltose regulon periplasmic protein [Klebsiella pneumoniae]
MTTAKLPSVPRWKCGGNTVRRTCNWEGVSPPDYSGLARYCPATAKPMLSKVRRMKMKKTLVALCLSAGMLACVPGMSLADVNFVPQNTSAAPAIPASALQQLIWTPADQSKTQSVDLTTGGQRLDVPGIVGPVAARSVPANIGELTLTLDSELNKHKQILRRTCWFSTRT